MSRVKISMFYHDVSKPDQRKHASVGSGVYALPVLGWHASYPTCWDGMNEQECPDSILCCGLFPNTPIDTTTGECAIMNPTQYDVCDATTGAYNPSMLCLEGILNSISYTEFAGLMIGMMSFGFIGDWMGLKYAVRILVDCLY